MSDQTNITVLLGAVTNGDAQAVDKLFNAVYHELRKLSRYQRRHWHGNDTLNTTALIHEAFIKLINQSSQNWQCRTHFYATASKAMRHILVNYAERKMAAKRGGDQIHIPLDDILLCAEGSAEELLNINQLLNSLEKENARRCYIVECRVFGGMQIEEIAEALSISSATVKREWSLASAWLYQSIQNENTLN